MYSFYYKWNGTFLYLFVLVTVFVIDFIFFWYSFEFLVYWESVVKELLKSELLCHPCKNNNQEWIYVQILRQNFADLMWIYFIIFLCTQYCLLSTFISVKKRKLRLWHAMIIILLINSVEYIFKIKWDVYFMQQILYYCIF